MPVAASDRIRLLQLAPWVDLGGSDKGTIDWFKWLDRERFSASLITTQPSPNRRVPDTAPYADELWTLPDIMRGPAFPRFIFDFLATRDVDVLHIMNSRIGFELLPDLASLARPPKVVVQLHVEEHDRSGYVRLVCTRFGNLVDAFSVTSNHLADAVHGYGIPRSRIHVISTGVDAEREFSPDHAAPVQDLGDAALHVLYPGRLVEQKDPALMVEVATLVAAERSDVRIHVVGEGYLEEETRDEVRRRNLGEVVRFHPTSNELAGWYAACDVLLMTSIFEGVPYVGYEAMAMGLPVVAPALPGNVELLADGGGAVISPRDDAPAYAAELLRFAADEERRVAVGARGRERALHELSVKEMARAHERLYERLTEALPPRLPAPPRQATPPTPRFARARTHDDLVSVVMPCFNHGQYLPASVAAVEAQTHQNFEILVVDDASTDPETKAALNELEHRPRIRVIRVPENSGPSAARNLGIERAQGRYIFPVDADNILLPDAMARLLEQLRSAGERIGFIYPSVQFFGNRRDQFDPPAYNLFELLGHNYCDTCSLFDRDVFDSGVRFGEIGLGHEDWDLILQLGARGIYGEPARAPVMFYRKAGFTRSDSVEHSTEDFAKRVRIRHPDLFGPETTGGEPESGVSPAVDIKARWAPGLTIAPLPPVEPSSESGHNLVLRLGDQTCRDAEILVRSEGQWFQGPGGPCLRRIPALLAATPLDALRDALKAAKAPHVFISDDLPTAYLNDKAFIEKLLRALVEGPEQHLIAFCDAGLGSGAELRRLEPELTLGRTPHAVLIRRDELAPPSFPPPAVDQASPISSLVASLNAQHGLRIEWRHLPARPQQRGGEKQAFGTLDLETPTLSDPQREAERAFRFSQPPALPAVRPDTVRRWSESGSWMPSMTKLLIRHQRNDGLEWKISTRWAHPGFVLDRLLGAVHMFQPPGTAELRSGGPEGFFLIPDADEGQPILRGPQHPDCLGYVEQAAFPLLDPLDIAHDPATHSWVLVAGADDPLRGRVDFHANVGFIEAFPNQPSRWPELERHAHGFVPLVRSVDAQERRHRYALNGVPPGTLSLELGALHTEPQWDSVPVWIEDGFLITEDMPGSASPRGQTRLKWAVAPLTWRGSWGVKPRARAVGRRVRDMRIDGLAAPDLPSRAPDAYLWRGPGAGRRALYSARHPITGDQFLTPWRLEAADLGYGSIELLGHTSFGFSLTGDFDRRTVAVPWASRFGERTRDYWEEEG